MPGNWDFFGEFNTSVSQFDFGPAFDAGYSFDGGTFINHGNGIYTFKLVEVFNCDEAPPCDVRLTLSAGETHYVVRFDNPNGTTFHGRALGVIVVE